MSTANLRRHLFTIGHSTRSLEELIQALQAHGVRTLVDIRTVPRSRHVPQFNRDVLEVELPAAGIHYLHMKSLGGLRSPPKAERKESPNLGWRNQGFRAYADYMLTEEFEEALGELLALARKEATAIMCAEALPWRCHRSLVADVLTLRGVIVEHIFDASKSQRHEMTLFARSWGQKVIYPAADQPQAGLPI